MSEKPQINVWYGLRQRFGHIGLPQRFVNVLGNVSHSEQIESLTCSLNGAAPRRLSIGPDDHRLARTGDFNADIPAEALREGDNELLLVAQTRSGVCDEVSVTLEYVAGKSWPLPYRIDWSTVNAIQDVAQVVDGLWKIEGYGVRTVIPYYDRVIAIGDMRWRDYEVKCPVTFHDFSRQREGPPCYGHVHASIGMRWTGHWDDGCQPLVQWYPLGAAVMFLLDPELKQCFWRMVCGKGRKRQTQTENLRAIQLGKPYQMKTRVQTLHDGGSVYSAKLWPADESEPSQWDLRMERSAEEATHGSVLLCPHNTDVTYGNVEITPL